MIVGKKTACCLLLLLVLLGEKALGQTSVKRYEATKDNGYGVVYSLPKTRIEIALDIEEERYEPGSFSSYALRYIGQEAGRKSYSRYRIRRSSLRSVGVPDSTARYLVAFDRRTVAPFVALTDLGIIASINGRSRKDIEGDPMPPRYSPWSEPDRVMPALPEEYNLAATEALQAQIAGSYYHRVRESLNDLAMGDVEQLPKDGEMMRLMMTRLEREERRTRRLFMGDTLRRTHHVRLYIDPKGEDVEVVELGRFSPYYGVLPEGDLSGEKLALRLEVTERAPQLSEKEQKRKEKRLEGMVYNMPGRAEGLLFLGEELLTRQPLSLTQVGTVEALREKMFDTKDCKGVEVYFNINDGSIVEIKQE